jgi:hypothetical protein
MEPDKQNETILAVDGNCVIRALVKSLLQIDGDTVRANGIAASKYEA